jgi:hypothetical protein
MDLLMGQVKAGQRLPAERLHHRVKGIPAGPSGSVGAALGRLGFGPADQPAQHGPPTAGGPFDFDSRMTSGQSYHFYWPEAAAIEP